MNRLRLPRPLLLLVAWSALILTGCGARIDSSFPDQNTTLYLEPDATVDFSVTGDTGNKLSYVWQLIHYDSNNQPVQFTYLPVSESVLARRYTFTAADANHFRTELRVSLHQEILDGSSGFPITVQLDSVTWEISKPVEKVGTQIPNSVFLRNSNDLPALSGISDVTGGVFLDGPTFRRVTTLSGVTHIGGDLLIAGSQIRTARDLSLNPALALEGSLVLRNNAHLNSLSGLEPITATHHLTIENNRLLTNLNGLINLEHVAGDLLVKNNLRLQNLSGVGALSSIGGDLRLDDNAALTSTTGLENVQTVYGSVSLVSNPELNSLEGFAGLQQIGGALFIGYYSPDTDTDYSTKLTNLSGLDALTHVNTISIEDCPQLQSLHGLEQLTSVTNNVNLSNNPALQNLHALKNLSSIRTIRLQRNSGLRNLQGLEKVRNLPNLEIDGGINIFPDSPGITSLTGIENIGSIGSLSLSNNPLQDLSALDNVAIIEMLALSNNNITQLPRIQGSELTTISIYNEPITSLDGLENITRLHSLWLSTNNQLTDLSGLSGLVHVEQSFSINNNATLCQAEADALLTQVQDAGGISNSVVIDMYNNFGCN